MQPRFDRHASTGTHDLTQDTENAPLRVDTQAGGGLSASSLDLGEHCKGYISNAADVRVNVAPKETASRSAKTAGHSSERTIATHGMIEIELRSDHRNALVVNGPDGQWYCAQSNAAHVSTVRLDGALIGQLDIWVANFHASQTHDATVIVRRVAD